MTIFVREAQELVVRAGRNLVKSGLVARTWGNISARVSDSQFAITPKGRAYDTLKPEDIVIVNIADCSYEGSIKPSSEKGVHAAVYQNRKDINFVIHTHQLNASVLSVLGHGIEIDGEEVQQLGKYVPNAEYGISSTKKLARNAAKSIIAHPDSVAFLLRSHGALLLGKTMDETFNRAHILEDMATKEIFRKADVIDFDGLRAKFLKDYPLNNNHVPPTFGRSVRHNDKFILTLNGEVHEYAVNDSDVTGIASIHQNIYRQTQARCIIHDITPDVLALSRTGKKTRPYIDDVAQIIGVDLSTTTIDDIDEAIKNRNAVLIHDAGALCLGNDEEDATAVAMILEKQCRSHMLVTLSGHGKPLSKIDCWLQRLVYTRKYSKLKNGGK